MRVLLDTHAFLWYMAGDDQLSAEARRLVDDRSNERVLSAASLWEMAIKSSRGRLDLGAPFGVLIPRLIRTNGLIVLGVTIDHAAAVATLQFPRSGHRDPFDRLLVAQSMVEGVPLLSRDGALDDYGVLRVW